MSASPRKMSRDEAIRLAALGDYLARDPGAPQRLQVSRDAVSRMILAIPLGKCPGWLAERRPKPEHEGVELRTEEVRELASLMLGQKGRDLNESIDRYWACVHAGEQPPPAP